MKFACLVSLLASSLLLSSCASSSPPTVSPPPSVSSRPPWHSAIQEEVSALGYGNWIVIADSSFPVHSRRGIRTLLVKEKIPAVLHSVILSLEETAHVRPRFHISRELRYVTNDRAPGIDQYRRSFGKSLHGHKLRQMDYRSLSLLLEDSSNKFTVLVFKTQTALPYASVFIELESGNWDNDSERNLRKKMKLRHS